MTDDDSDPVVAEALRPSTPTRVCGRCRGVFPADPDQHPVAIPDWWACPACRSALFGDEAVADAGVVQDGDQIRN
ncbi:MAG: hypothetical protein ACR2LQ_09855 [Acidimicrobiales bacterium]